MCPIFSLPHGQPQQSGVPLWPVSAWCAPNNHPTSVFTKSLRGSGTYQWWQTAWNTEKCLQIPLYVPIYLSPSANRCSQSPIPCFISSLSSNFFLKLPRKGVGREVRRREEGKLTLLRVSMFQTLKWHLTLTWEVYLSRVSKVATMTQDFFCVLFTQGFAWFNSQSVNLTTTVFLVDVKHVKLTSMHHKK